MVTRDELNASITRLRERRMSIPELRDYKPQSRKGSAKDTPTSTRPVEETFADLFNRGGNPTEEGGEVT